MFLSSALLLTFGIMLNPGVGVALMCAQAVLLLLNTWRLCGAKATDASAEITAPHSKGGFVAFFKNTPSQATAQDLAPSLSI